MQNLIANQFPGRTEEEYQSLTCLTGLAVNLVLAARHPPMMASATHMLDYLPPLLQVVAAGVSEEDFVKWIKAEIDRFDAKMAPQVAAPLWLGDAEPRN